MAELNRDDVFEGGLQLKKLIEDLDSMFPPPQISPRTPIEYLLFKGGNREVIDYLKRKLED